MEMGYGGATIIGLPTALTSQVISEPHLPSKSANRLRLALITVKGKFLECLTPCERVKALFTSELRGVQKAFSKMDIQRESPSPPQ
ncbi:hypothetical protein AVEN_7264-1 [Araneus ventricosus]|uniref:Uncharacterized protein n=1 Tax=Araneus ventricosus TaxID=182803 RepID=A0A4Y2XAK8_ARAVE|nr:hypothetical protein AVEN_7264-1 [Araneus ventricosus]